MAWWLVSSLIGWLGLPLAWRFFYRLPDRGYGLSRAFGLLVVGYVLWLGASLQFLPNDLGGVLGGLLLLAGLSLWAGTGRWREIRTWLGDQRLTVLAMELLFFGLFAVWSFVRANNPEIVATEKPMELAFLNALMRSRSFPPQDPWLSGFAISYYYFGYVLLSVLTRLTGVGTAVAFNLGNALWFGLTGLGAYALVYNLLASRNRAPRLSAPLLGPVFVLITGNLEGFLDVLHTRHAFWRMDDGGELTSRFWKWLDLKQLVDPPVAPPPEPILTSIRGNLEGFLNSWVPDRYLWWWRASRVVRDVNLAGADIEVIDEFPFFSFLLADNHPHVLALPFVLLALGYALHVFLRDPQELDTWVGGLSAKIQIRRYARWLLPAFLGIAGLRALLGLALAGDPGAVIVASIRLAVGIGLAALLLGGLLLASTDRIPLALKKREFWFSAWLFGALAFLNTWDFPIYLTVLVASAWWGLRSLSAPQQLSRSALTGVLLVAAGLLLYLPWYPTFASQASGILPNLAFPTRLTHVLIMFGPLIVPIIVWLAWLVRRAWQGLDLWLLVGISIGLPLGLLLLSWTLSGAALIAYSTRDPTWLNPILDSLGASDMRSAAYEILGRRLAHSGSALTLGALTAGVALLLRRAWQLGGSGGSGGAPQPTAFVLMLVGVGGLLVLGPEFVYLRDLFGTRMNTVFKFYYATWVLWGLAAAYLITELWPPKWNWPSWLRALSLIPLLFGLVYPALATWTKTNGFRPIHGRSLDGTHHLSVTRPEEYAAIQWINRNLPDGIITEAVGGSYTEFARIATHTGLPTVLGWEFHEVQWRGSADQQGSRKEDIRRLYESRDWKEALGILNQYDISYVYIGPLERASYQRLVESKFEAGMSVAYRNQGITIYSFGRSRARP